MDYLPISMLNQLEYCARRFWLMFVQGEMEVNAPVLDGTLRHERAHTAGREREGDKEIHRRVYVYSDALRLVGFIDVLEEVDNQLVPVEYKRGRMGRWLNDHVQLCAQALCLEERLAADEPQASAPDERLSVASYGYVFYFGNRRRERVEFTAQLRQQTQASVARAFALLQAGEMPPPTEKRAKCHDCSLEPICLPREVSQLLG
ncbi:MAG: CRISPR-associated protein Cas4 [Chloroflexota bacterium]